MLIDMWSNKPTNKPQLRKSRLDIHFLTAEPGGATGTGGDGQHAQEAPQVKFMTLLYRAAALRGEKNKSYDPLMIS